MQSPAKEQLYEGTGLVFEDRGEIALCLGGATASVPPQCDETKIAGWSWKGLEYDEMGDVRWGTYTMRGTYIDGVFTLKNEPVVPEPFHSDGVTSPCPEPPEGWDIPEPDRTTEEHLQEARRAAEAQSGFAGMWIDYIVEPADEQEMQPWGENIVLVLAFTGDPERHEAQAREQWGGALCIWINDRTFKELRSIQRDFNSGWIEDMGIESTFSDIDIQAGTAGLGVIVSTSAFEAELVERYGKNTVEVHAALQPVD